ncbi:hypothetical protein Tco_1443862 [Tanacetum coccineum]
MSDSEHSTVSYTSVSSDSDPSAWGIPLMDADEIPEMDPYEEVAQQGQAAPPSPAYVPDPIELEDYVLVYVLELMYLEYLVSSNDDIPVEDPGEELEEDPIDYADDDEDEEEEFSKDDDDEEEEDHLAPADSTAIASLAVDHVPSTKEIKPFETDESAATPPPPAYHTTSRMLLALTTPPPSPLTPLSSPLPQIPPPPTSPTYAQAPLGYRATMIRAASPPTHHPLPLHAPSTSHKADILEADIPHQKRLLFTAHTPRFEVGENFDAAARQLGSTMDQVVKLRVSYQADVYRPESEEFYTQHQDAQRDHAALRDEVYTLRRYLSSLCTTHEQERVKARPYLDRTHIIVLLDTSCVSKHWRLEYALILWRTLGVTPYVVDMTVEMGKNNSLDDIIISGYFPPLSMPGTITVGNAPGKSLYANITGKPSEKKVNVRTLYTPGGNGIDVVVLADSIRAISECFANTAYGFFLGKKVAYPVVANYVRNTWVNIGLFAQCSAHLLGYSPFNLTS